MATLNYAAGMPNGKNNMPISQDTPAPFKAVEQYYAANGGTSSVVTLTENTTAIEVAAQGAAVVMRWVYVTDGTGANTSVISTPLANANFDHVVPANTQRRFVVPIEVQYSENPNNSVVGQNIANGLFKRLAFKNEGVGSVFVTEYGSSNSY